MADNSLDSGYSVTFTIHRPAGDLVIEGWETWEGGVLEPASSKHRNAVTRKSTARGGLKERSSLTVSRECDAATWALKSDIDDAAGVDKYTAVRQKISLREETIGDPETVTGIVGTPTWPNYDINGGDSIGVLSIESETDE